MSKEIILCDSPRLSTLLCVWEERGYNALSYQVTENDTLFICDAEQWEIVDK